MSIEDVDLPMAFSCSMNVRFAHKKWASWMTKMGQKQKSLFYCFPKCIQCAKLYIDFRTELENWDAFANKERTLKSQDILVLEDSQMLPADHRFLRI